MPTSKKLFLQAKKVIPSGINSPVRRYDPYPFFVKKAQGSVIWDVDGKKYLDFCNGYGALLLGHQRKEIIKFEGCYHGAHDYVLVKAGSGAAHQGIAFPEVIKRYFDNALVGSSNLKRIFDNY